MRLNYGEIFITKTHKNITKTGKSFCYITKTRKIKFLDFLEKNKSK